jgi:hypothetical protein
MLPMHGTHWLTGYASKRFIKFSPVFKIIFEKKPLIAKLFAINSKIASKTSSFCNKKTA